MRHQSHLVALARPRKTIPSVLTADATLAQLLEQLPDAEVDVHEEAVTNIERARLRRLLRALPVLERKVVVARYGLLGETLSCRQLAQRLGMSSSNVSAIEHRALERLRGMYGLADAA